MAKHYSMLTVLLVSMFLSLGCKDSSEDTESESDSDSAVADNTIQIFSWWTSAGEAGALQALIDEFVAQYQVMEVVNVSAEVGHGQDARQVLADRMAANDPPDTFQLSPRDVQLWVEYNGNAADNRLEALDSLFTTEGWATDYPEGVLEVLRYNGTYYAVPVNMHRQNAMFYNKDLVPTPPTTMAELLTLAASLDSQGIVPLAVSAGTGGWTLEIIFFSIMAGGQGPQFHQAFFTGALDMTDAINVEKFRAALADYSTLMGYAHSEAGAIGWEAAADQVMDGTAAMYIHGDWAKGYYESKSWSPGVDFGVVAVPGSASEFIYNVDTFALCAGAQHRENALNFLRVIGSATAQEAFNKVKGSTPVHPGVDVSSWDIVAQNTFKDYESATILHNVEIHQFVIPDATADSGTVGLQEKLLELFNGSITEDELVTWVTENYVVATQ